MKKYLAIIVIILSVVNYTAAQLTEGFEQYDLESNSFLNGSDGGGAFTTEYITLPNDYNSMFLSWSGWAISNTTDNTTPGFNNQYSAITGTGYNSDTYAVSYTIGSNSIQSNDGYSIKSLRITNSTYAYLSMLEGDAFTKRFGGITGDDPDFFRIKFKLLSNNVLIDTIDYYLADYRASGDADYIIDDWELLDLSNYDGIDRLEFSFESSDVGQFGINTPTYFCIDNVIFERVTSNTDIELRNSISYPNPCNTFITITGLVSDYLDVISLDGRKYRLPIQGINTYDTTNLPQGTYFIISAINNQAIKVAPIIKH